MKTCPDCAESIQDAARKCRFCGYRFDDETADGADSAEGEPADGEESALTPGPHRPVSAEATAQGPSRGFLAIAGGATAIFVGGLAGCIALAMQENVGREIAIAHVGGLVIGGALLALGWGLVWRRGQGGAGAFFGSLLLVAGQLAALSMGGNASDAMLLGLIANAGMVACLFLHLGTLEAVGFGGTKVAAMLALLGVGGEMFSFAKHWDLPAWLWVALAWCGVVGVALFGLSLLVAATLRIREG